jgi:hypothetical protein
MDGRYYISVNYNTNKAIVWKIDYFTREEKWAVNKLFLQAIKKNYLENNCPISLLPVDVLKYIYSFVFG